MGPGRPEPGTFSFIDYVEDGEQNFQDQLPSGQFLLFGFSLSFGTGEKWGVITEEGEQPGSGTFEGELIAVPVVF